MKKIVLTGGGTGGHVIPHLSLLPYLKKEYEIHYLGTDGIEQDIISKYDEIAYHTIKAVKLDRSKKLKNLLLPFKLLSAIKQCKKILRDIKPNIIFSKGGFVSVPVVIAAHKLKIPIVSHESDLSFGLANKIIYRYCNCMCTSFEQTTQGKSKCVFTGSPIRQSLFSGNKDTGYKQTNLKPTQPTIMFMGGSTGASQLNNVIYQVLPTLTREYNIVHLVGRGKADYSKTYPNYCQIEYCDNIQDLFAISDYVVSRAGSNAIFEIAALKKPMLLIPLPKGASRGDQVENAELFCKLGYAHTAEQEGLTAVKLLNKIEQLKKDKNNLIFNLNKADFGNASQKIYQNIVKYTLK